MKQYINYESILGFNESIAGVTTDYKNSNWVNVKFSPDDSVFTNINIFTNRGDYIGSDDSPAYKLDVSSGEILYDLKPTFEKFSISNGSYKLGFSTFNFIAACTILETSPDQTEFKLNKLSAKLILPNANYSLRFAGYIYRINNIKSDDLYTYIKTETNVIYNGEPAYIVQDYTSEIFETVNIFNPMAISPSRKIKGPKFDIDADSTDTEMSVFKCWTDLLATDQTTSQNIIDLMFNSDNSVTLNIDWTNFQNYIFYSKAESRLNIFYEKIKLIETFNAKIDEINSIAGSADTVTQYKDSIKKIIINFDAFERYLYFQTDEKIFTHDIIGPVKPWPKQLIGNATTLLSSTHATTISWFNNLITLAHEYDRQNTRSLWYSIPEHVLMDDGNSQYILFIEMIGQHFDNIWLYTNALTEIHNKDEHPDRGPAKELLTSIAESFGWKLANNRNLTDLWLYKLGVDSNGNELGVDNMLTHESQSQQVWRRIINNLPYLLKTKGTYRSISALMSIYGIPSTLISTKEYGGTEFNDTPIHIEDRYHYKLYMGMDMDRKLDFTYSRGQELIESSCKTIISNTDFTNGLLGWDISLIGWDFPELIDAESGNAQNIPVGTKILILNSSETNVSTKLTGLQIGKRYEVTFNSYSPSNAILNVEINQENTVVDVSSTPNVYNISFIATTETGILEFISVDPNIWIWGISTSQISYPQRFVDTIEFRFQHNMPEEGDLCVFTSTDPGNIDFFNEININFAYVDDKHRLLRFTINNWVTGETIHESDLIPYSTDEFYTFRIYKDLSDQQLFRYNLAMAGDSLFGDIKHEVQGEFRNNELLNNAYEHVLMVKFNGWFQGYKDYFDTYSYKTFCEHVLNPGSYSTDDFNGPYNTLNSYYPFGLDLQKFTHVDTHTSSQPNRNYFETTGLTLSGFSSVDQNLNYDNDVETYYIDSPMIGGYNIYSKKIRISDNLVDGAVLSDQHLPLTNTFTNSDTNRLAIVFSLADQINRDVFNHINGQDLNNSIGNPMDEFNDSYSDLDRLRHLYFKKYQTRNDINAFIRLLSAYDYTFFDQIKQLVPGSANLIAGILIEPHVLEKNKSKILNRLEITVNNIDLDYNLRSKNPESDESHLDADIINITDLEIAASALYTTITHATEINITASELQTLLKLNYEILSTLYESLKPAPIKINIGGIGGLETMIDKPRIDCRYKKKIKHYTDENRVEYSVYRYFDDINEIEVGPGAEYVITNSETSLMEINNVDKRPFKTYINVVDSILNPTAFTYIETDVKFYGIALPTGRYICRFYIEWLNGTNTIPGNAVALVEFNGNEVSGSGGFGLRLNNPGPNRIVAPYYLELTTLSDDILDISLILRINDGITTDSVFRIYGFDIFDYKTLYQREMLILNNMLNYKKQFDTLEQTSYQHDEYAVTNNIRFIGTKISSPGWNIPSDDTLDKGPVVEYFDVDPTYLTVSQENQSNIKIN